MSSISQEAIDYIKKHKSELIAKFASLDNYPKSKYPFTFFMAGSPGAGKTETSEEIVKLLSEKLTPPAFAARIDADEIKGFIPQYNGTNSDDIQGASALGVQKLFDYVTDKDIPAVIEGTFCNQKISLGNIKRTLNHGRSVGIFYIYQDPIKAWKLTLARGNKNGRYIPVDFFLESLHKSKQNVNEVKKKYGKKIYLAVIQKDYEGGSRGLKKFDVNVSNVDSYIKIDYDIPTLKKKLIDIEKRERANNGD